MQELLAHMSSNGGGLDMIVDIKIRPSDPGDTNLYDKIRNSSKAEILGYLVNRCWGLCDQYSVTETPVCEIDKTLQSISRLRQLHAEETETRPADYQEVGCSSEDRERQPEVSGDGEGLRRLLARSSEVSAGAES